MAIGGAFRLGRIAGRSRRVVARHPRVAAALAVPAVAFLVLVPDLFGAIPWSVKKPVGWVAFLSLLAAGLARLLTVKPGDRWLTADRREAVPDRWGWAAPWVLAAAVGSLTVPLLQRPEALGFGDYDHHLQKFEAIRRTILDYGQFPWWTPWCRGGFPLASEPECGVVSVATPLVLALGPRVGLRLANVLCLMIAAEGTRRLARWWIIDPWAAAVAGLVYSLHGGMAVYVAAGHYIPMSYCATPWLIVCVNRLADGPRYGVGLGLWAAFDVLNGISYPSVYALMIAAVVWLRGLRVEQGRRRRFLEQSAVAVGVGLLLTGWRLGTMASVLRDYPREMWPTVDLEPLAPLFLMLDRPRAEVAATMTNPLFWESNCYVGFVGVGLFALSIRGGLRWWHVLALVCFWLMLGGTQWYEPSYWLAHWPVFATMHAVIRWRIPAMLGVGLGIGQAIAAGKADGRRGVRLMAVAAGVVLAADLLTLAHSLAPIALGRDPAEDRFPGPSVERVVNVQWGPSFPATLRGYGVIRAHEPLLGYDRGAPTARLWRKHPDYVGESWTERGPVEPFFWSPNRLEFRVGPFEEVHVNQNPGSWWLVNGFRRDAGLRCAEWTLPFSARADTDGRLELRIAPKGLRTGLGLHAAGLGIVVAALGLWWWRRPSPRPGRDDQQQADPVEDGRDPEVGRPDL